jgi:hypothetical protein
MTFDENLSFKDKLDYLLRTLDNTLAKKETESAPTLFKDADYKTWRNILLGLSTIEHFAGNFAMEEELTRERYECVARIECNNGGGWEICGRRIYGR